tara:strand:- start:3074 stop:4123 length:1050 start_codon:yes stop_codon:yes gene_type:complete
MAELVPNVAKKRPRLLSTPETSGEPTNEDESEESSKEESEESEEEGEEEGEEESGEESEEESGEENEEESSNTVASCDSNSNGPPKPQIQAFLKKLDARVSKLKRQKRKLEGEVNEWRQRAEAAEAALETGDATTTATIATDSPHAGPESAVATNGKSIISMPDKEHPFGISVILPDYKTDPVGTVYKNTHIKFPHRIIPGKDGRDRIFVVEARPNITITARLFNWLTKDCATEYDVSPTGLLKLKLEVLFADTHEVVKVADLGKSTYHLFNPPEEQIAEKRMVAGEVSWTFKCQFSSRATKNPSNRDFLFRVRCTNPELSHIEQLTFTTPFSFKVISRQYNRVSSGEQ